MIHPVRNSSPQRPRGRARAGVISNGVKIGVMGARGSFSEEAGRTYAHKNRIKRYSIEYLVSAENVLSAIEDGSIDIGIFPIENSNGGIVIEAVHAMAKHQFHIKKMFEIDVHHNLLVKKGTTADKIKTITSHDQAIKQCRMYLKRIWPKVKIKEYADTAKAAEDLAKGKLPASTAVIASRAAADVYKLDILDESIQDLKFNYTSFIAGERMK
jgi:prephenate dehydratase